MRALVTGADGFIGRCLTGALQEEAYEVTRLTRTAGDVSLRRVWDALPDTDVVIHLAAKTRGRGQWSDPGDFFRSNVVGTVEMLRYASERRARVVHLSSYLYGNPTELPVAETAPLVATNPYSLSKKEAEDACRFYAEASAIDVTVLRPFNVYGPGQRVDFLIPSILEQAKSGTEITVADAQAKRDYVHIQDTIAAIVLAVRKPLGYRVLNIGTGQSHSVGDIIAILERLTVKSYVVRALGKPSSIVDCRADIRAARDLLGWSPRISLEAGIASMIKECPAHTES